jgi:cytochrome P450
MISPHTSTSFDPRHWTHPQQFDPGRYLDVPTSSQVDEAKSKQIGFASAFF